MRKVENYRPADIVFTAESSEVPSHLGKFEDTEEAHKFIKDTFVATSSRFTAFRKMDDYEIEQLRHEYQEELEAELPQLKARLYEAERILADAKEQEKLAKEAVSASLNKIQQLSDEAREGVTEMNLDQAFTYEVVYNGKRFYYTIIDKQIKLCGVRNIPEYEQEDLLSSSERNAYSFEDLKSVVGE